MTLHCHLLLASAFITHTHTPATLPFISSFATLRLAAPNPPFIVPLYESRDIPYSGENATEHEHVSNSSSQGRIISHVTVPQLEVFLPSTTTAVPSTPAIIIMPGGSFTKLYYDKEGTWVAKWLASLGFAAVVLKYRVPIGLPNINVPGLLIKGDFASEIYKPLSDSQRAVGVVRSNSQRWGINSSCVGVMGFSAGGSLGAFLVTHGQKRLYVVNTSDPADILSARPDFFIGAYPVPIVAALSPVPNPNNPAQHTPLPGLIVTHESPPSFVVQAQDDPFGPQHSVAWWEAVNKAGSKSSLSVFSEGGHGFATCQEGARSEPNLVEKEVCSWTQRVLVWLRFELVSTKVLEAVCVDQGLKYNYLIGPDLANFPRSSRSEWSQQIPIFSSFINHSSSKCHISN